MPYKRPESSYYQIRRKRLPGYGDTGVISTGVRDRRTAERMEHLLDELAERAITEPRWTQLLDAVKERRITLIELLRAKSTRRLEALLVSLHDPLLSIAVEEYKSSYNPGRQIEYGFDKLLRLAPPASRVSYLTSRTITDLCLECEREGEGRKRNTVRRQLYRAISKLLTWHYGQAERNRIFDEVDFPAEDDVREVDLTQEEIARLLSKCRGELATIVRMALLTSADRGVLLSGRSPDGHKRGLLVRDLRIYQEEDESYSGEAYLKDTKTTSRPRTVVFGDRMARELIACVQGKSPDDPVFNLKYMDLDFVWQRAREEANLPHVRFKDLRSQTAIYAQRAGIPQAVAMRTLGHSSERRTRDYQRHEAVMSPQQASALEQAIFGTVSQTVSPLLHEAREAAGS